MFTFFVISSVWVDEINIIFTHVIYVIHWLNSEPSDFITRQVYIIIMEVREHRGSFAIPVYTEITCTEIIE